MFEIVTILGLIYLLYHIRFFFKEGNVTCGGPKCAAYERKDKNYVYFEKVEEGK